MFSQEARCVYRKNQLNSVICQLRFPDILSIEANLPVEFQEAIRDEFPQFSSRKETPAPKVVGIPGNMHLENQAQCTNYTFTSADGAWRANLTSKFISLACFKYTCWEDFAKRLDKPLAAFIKIYKPAYFERLGLRYVNLFSRNDLELTDVPYRDMVSACWLGPLLEEDVMESAATKCGIDVEISLRGGCRAKIHSGPVLLRQGGQTDPEPKFAFDQDLFMTGKVPVNYSAGSLETLHSQAYSIFRGAITEMLHNAMEPEYE